jgi:hypothetical protein
MHNDVKRREIWEWSDHTLLHRFDLVSSTERASRRRAARASGNHVALEQFVRDGRRHAVEKRRPPLWIVPQDVQGTLRHIHMKR